jgi:hypothetical protein
VVDIREANDELVAEHYIRSILPLAYRDSVATTLPADRAKWKALGFARLTVVGGTGDGTLEVNEPVIQVDCYAHNDSAATPWPLAADLASRIIRGTRTATNSEDRVLRPNYEGARVLYATILGRPRRVPNDPSGFARYMFELSIRWVPAP